MTEFRITLPVPTLDPAPTTTSCSKIQSLRNRSNATYKKCETKTVKNIQRYWLPHGRLRSYLGLRAQPKIHIESGPTLTKSSARNVHPTRRPCRMIILATFTKPPMIPGTDLNHPSFSRGFDFATRLRKFKAIFRIILPCKEYTRSQVYVMPVICVRIIWMKYAVIWDDRKSPATDYILTKQKNTCKNENWQYRSCEKQHVSLIESVKVKIAEYLFKSLNENVTIVLKF